MAYVFYLMKIMLLQPFPRWLCVMQIHIQLNKPTNVFPHNAVHHQSVPEL